MRGNSFSREKGRRGRRKENLLTALEEAPTTEARGDILKRITEIDEQNTSLLSALAEEGASDALIAQEIEKLTTARLLINQFDEIFEIASIGERKTILRECLRDIIVDRKREVVVYNVRPLPAGQRRRKVKLEGPKTHYPQPLQKLWVAA